MSLIGYHSVARISVGRFTSFKHFLELEVEDVGLTYKIPDALVWIPDWLIPETLSYSCTEDNPVLVATQSMQPENVSWAGSVSDTDVVQTHVLTADDAVVSFGVSDAAHIAQTHLFTGDDVAWAYALDDLSLISEHALTGDDVDYAYALDDTPVAQTQDLTMENVDYYFSTSDPLMFLPRECMSYQTTRELDTGIRTQFSPGEDPLAETNYGQTFYTFTLVWEMVDDRVRKGVEGFFQTYLHEEFNYNWPGDGEAYVCTMLGDPQSVMIDGGWNWRVSVSFRGYKLNSPAGELWQGSVLNL